MEQNSRITQLTTNIHNLDVKFRKACQQVAIIDRYIHDLKIRYARALKNGSKGFCCSVRLRLISYQGMRNMMYEYATIKCEEIERLQDELLPLLTSDQLQHGIAEHWQNFDLRWHNYEHHTVLSRRNMD